MKIGEVLRLDYDDNAIDIIDKFNAALKEHGLEFVDDGLAHDGFILMTLTRVERASE